MGGRAGAAAGGVLLAALALLGSGCSADSSAKDEASARSAVGKADRPAAKVAPSGPAALAGGPSAAATAGRSIAYTAELRLEVKDVPAALERLRSMTSAAGGYVSSENLDRGSFEEAAADQESSWVEGASEVVVKVPSAAFDRTLDTFGGLGKVLQRHREAADVTDQVVDVESRLKTQRASVQRVRALMGQATTITEVVALESELSRREADLESLERQQQELASKTSLSTITVGLSSVAPPASAPAAKENRGFWGSVGHALAAGWHALYATVRGVLVVLAAVAPFALVLVPAGWLAVRLRRRHGTAAPALAEPAAAVEPAERPEYPAHPERADNG
ncbi:DUF4349 domain-containing protein [Peterkaempfera bronchialis]|uniref:DUF4349 domain-containing protein n=1 Tax=Peterkaempfera bronchialis TaxID=2126346 RepID=UPI003C2FA308